MIRFALKCENDHHFESWFQSGEAFDQLGAQGLVTCPRCGVPNVTKELMAPKVRASRKRVAAPEPEVESTPQQMVATPDKEVAEALQKLRTHVEQNSDYVGDRFAKEARAMHEGDAPHRAIHGEAKPEEAKKLIEDGVPALPLPFIPRQKTN